MESVLDTALILIISLRLDDRLDTKGELSEVIY